MTTQNLLIEVAQGQADFAAVLAHIDAHYAFSPTAFDNGSARNAAGENSGSCKLFSFAQLEGLDATQTLSLFAEHYRAVLANPSGNDHANIRALQDTGLGGVQFAQQPLKRTA